MVVETALRLAQTLINRQIDRSATAKTLCSELEGRCLRYQITDLDRSIYVCVTADGVSLVENLDVEPEADLIGTFSALLALLGPEPEAVFRENRVETRGDGTVLQSFRRLIDLAKPDWEEELSGLIGDVPAHQLGNLARDAFRWGTQAADTLMRDVGEFLQQESRDLPSRPEVDRFAHRVRELRSDTDRLEARINRLEGGRELPPHKARGET